MPHLLPTAKILKPDSSVDENLDGTLIELEDWLKPCRRLRESDYQSVLFSFVELFGQNFAQVLDTDVRGFLLIRHLMVI